MKPQGRIIFRWNKLLVIPIVIIGLLVWLLWPRGEAEANWYNESWQLRTPLTVDGTGSASSNKRVKFDIDTATLITNNKMQSDCGDSRFTDSTGTLLEYYIDSAAGACNTASTDYWVLIPGTVSVDPFVIYHYYSNGVSANGTNAAQFSQTEFAGYTTSSGTETKSPGPVAFWKFDEGTDNTCSGGVNDVCDGTAGQNDLAKTGATWKAKDVCLGDSCLQFDGTDDYLKLDDDPDLDFTANDSFTISGWFKHEPETTGTESLLTKQSGGLFIGSTSTTTITTSTSEGLGQGVGSWSHRVEYDPNNDRWHVLYIDTDGTDLHTRSSAATSGTSWTDGTDINVAVASVDYEDFSCVTETDASTTYMHCVMSASDTDLLYYRRCTLTGTTPFISCDAEQTVYDSADNVDDITLPRIAVDSNDCVLIVADVEDDSIATASDEHQIYLWKEAATCGDGTWATAAGYPFTDLDTTSPGYTTDAPVGIEAFDGTDAQIYMVNDDTASAVIMNTVYFDGTAMGTVRVLDADVEFNTNRFSAWSVISGVKNTTFSLDDGTTDLDGWNITTKNAALGSQVDTLLNISGTVASSPQLATAIVDTNASGADDIWLFAANNTDQTDIYYNTSTGFGTSWPAGTLWVDSFDTTEVKFLSAGFNNENCDAMVSWLGNSASPFNVNSKIINTGSCSSGSAGAGYSVKQESDGDISFTVSDGTSSDVVTSTAATYDDNKWHNFSAVKDGTASVVLYIDGNKVAQDTSIAATGTLANSSPLFIGTDYDGLANDFDGFLENFKVYRYARTEAQVKTDAIHEATKKGSSAVVGAGFNANLNENLVGYWKLDESAGPAIDSSGNKGTGTWAGNVAVAAGKFGSAASFDGTTDYISVTNNSSVKGAEGATVSVWFRPALLNGVVRNLYSEVRNSDGSNRFQFSIAADNQLAFGGRAPDSSSYTTFVDHNVTLSVNTWYHAVAVFDSNTDRHVIYLNGEPFYGSAAVSAFDNTDPNEVPKIGASTGGTESFNGQIDEVRVYNRALSPVEAQALYNFAPNPIGWWKLDENTGATAYDSSTNSYSGTITNSPIWATGKIGGSVLFDGGNETINMGDINAIDGLSAMTVSGWIKPNALDDQKTVIGKYNDTAGLGWRLGTGGVDSNQVIYSVATDGTFIVPAGITSLTVKAWGAGGGGGSGGSGVGGGVGGGGGFAQGTIVTTPGESLGIVIGGGGNGDTAPQAGHGGGGGGVTAAGGGTGGNEGDANGGGGGGGGGYAAVKRSSTFLIQAGGGGGGGGGAQAGSAGGAGGAGGGSSGVAGTAVSGGGGGGGEGTSGAGGAVGSGGTGGAAGSANTGGGGSTDGSNGNGGGGGGGAGRFGGGGGGAGVTDDAGGGAGGGSSLVSGTSTVETAGSGVTPGNNSDADKAASCSTSGTGGAAGGTGAVGTNGNPGCIVLTYDGTGAVGSADAAIIQFDSANTAVTNSIFANDVWGHWAMVFDGSQTGNDNRLKFYYNGVQQGLSFDGTIPAVVPSSAYDFRINGTTDNIGFFTGAIDDVQIFNYPLNNKQIVNIMNGRAGDSQGVGSPIGHPVAYWKFDDGYGTNAQDSSSNNNDLTLPTASWTKSGKYNMAWDGTGSSRLSRSSDADLEFSATDDFAISFWFKSDSASNPAATEYIVADGGPAGSAGYAVYTNTSGNICFGIDDDSSWGPDVASCTTDDLYDNTWHYVTAMRNSASYDKTYIYVDGYLKDSDTDTTTATLDSSPTFFVGDMDTDDAGSGEEFAGDIDELKIYRFALNESDIKLEYNRGASALLGSSSTASNGITADNSSAREYCVPGDTSSCSAPIGEWKLDENTGTTINDTSTGGFQLTTSSCGTPVWVPGKFGSALMFDGTDDCVDENDVNMPSLVITGNVSLSAWVYRRRINTDDYIIHKDGDGGGSGSNKSYQLYLNDTDNILRMAWSYGSDVTYTVNSTAAVDGTNQWIYLSATRDTSTRTVNFYMNGSPLGIGVTYPSANDPTDGTGSPGDFNIGSATNAGSNDFFDGYLDNARVYNYVRTPAQVAWEYNRGGPVAWYKLDECQDTTAYNSVKNANGAAIGNNGTITIGATGPNTAIGTCTSGTSTHAWNNGTSGKINSSLDFDGADDIVTITNTSAIDLNEGLANGFTVASWIYPNSDGESNFGEFFYKNNITTCATTSESGSYTDLNCSVSLTTSGASKIISQGLTLNTWNHVVIGWTNDSDDEITIWINGKNVGSSTNGSGNPSNDTSNFYIGGDSLGVANFDGKIDDFRVYNYELTNQQVRDVYNNGAVGFK